MIHVSLGSDENRQKHSFQKRSPGKYVCMFFIPDQPASKASKWEAKGEPSYPASSFPLTSGGQTSSSRQASMRSKGGDYLFFLSLFPFRDFSTPPLPFFRACHLGYL